MTLFRQKTQQANRKISFSGPREFLEKDFLYFATVSGRATETRRGEISAACPAAKGGPEFGFFEKSVM